MIPADAYEPSEKIAELLSAGDEALAAGAALPVAQTASLPPQEQELLQGALACLRRLEGVWPRGDRSALFSERESLSTKNLSNETPGLAKDEERTGAAEEAGQPVRLGRFLLHHSLGSGGFGTVFLATDTTLHRQVALKLPRLEVSLQPELRRRFLQEARAAGVLDHPHIVPVHEAGEIDSLCYIASPYIKGPSLSSWLKSHAPSLPSPRSAAVLIAQLAEAISYVHGRGIVHRDLKPGNILLQEACAGDRSVAMLANAPANAEELTTKFVPRITDFGLARSQESNQGDTRTGVAFGTPAYMSPEQAQGHWSEVGPATDIYSLGTILYELLAGRAPFKGVSDLEVQVQIVDQEPVSPRRLRREVPRDLELICLKCLAKHPGERYMSAAMLAADLRAFLAGEAITARPRGPLQRGWRQLARRPATVAAALFAFIALATAMAVGVWQLGERRHLARLAHLDQYARLVGEANEALVRADYRVLGDLLSQLRPKPGEEDLRGFEWRYLQQEFWNAGPHFRILPQNIGPIAFSPDGRYLAADCNRAIEILKSGTGESVSVLRGHTDSINSMLFLAGGDELVSSSKDGTIRFWNVQKGRERQCLSDLPDVYQISGCRDGSRLAFTANSGISVYDRTGGMVTKRYELPKTHKANACALSPDGSLLAVGSNSGLSWYDAANGRIIAASSKVPNYYAALAFSNDGRLLAYSDDENLVIYNTTSRQVLATRTIRRSDNFALIFLPDGDRLVTCSPPQAGSRPAAEVQVLDWKANEVLASTTEAGFTAVPVCGNLSVSPDGRIVAMGCTEGVIRYWLPQGAGKVPAPRGHDSEVWCLAYSPDGQLLASGGDDNLVRVWDRNTSRQIATLAHPDLVVSLDFSPDGKSLATGCYGGSVRLWDTSQMAELWVQHESQKPIRRVHFAPGEVILAAGDSRDLYAFNRNDGSVRSHIPAAAEAEIACMVLSQDGKTLYAGDGRGILYAWDASTGQALWKQSDYPIFLNLALAPDDKILASAHADGSVRLLDPRTGSTRRVLNRHKSGVKGLVFSPDGRTLASAGDDHQIRLWHVETGRELVALVGPTQQVNALAFAPDGLLLAAACHDSKIYQWQGTDLDSVPCPISPGLKVARGDGDFSAKVSADTLGEVVELAIADLSNSFRQNIAALCRDKGTIQFFDLDQRLRVYPYSRAETPGATQFTIADFNKDGTSDLACALQNGVQVRWTRNSIFFFEPSPVFRASSPASVLASGDFDGDGRLDLVYLQSQTNEVGVLLSRHRDTFAAQPNVKTAAGPAHLAVADLDGDGKLDLVVACAGSNCLSILRGKGDGTFQPAGTLATADRPTWVALADLDGDGKIDIVVTQEGSNSLGVFMGKGNGTFGERRDLQSGKGCRAVAAADLNDDGILDLACVNHTDSTLSVFLGRGNGFFHPARHFPTGTGPHRLAVADVNRDGLKDIVVGCKEGKSIEVHFARPAR